MSTTKRSRRQASPPPASKRLKSSHVPAPQTGSGLGFLVDENARAGKKLNAKLTNGVPQSKSNRVDDSRAAVARNIETIDSEDDEVKPEPEIIELSSNSESSDPDSDDDDDVVEQQAPQTNGHHVPQEEEDVQMIDEVDGEAGDATFGDLLQARHPQPIDVSKALQAVDSNSRSLVTSSDNQLRAPLTSASLGTVLTQALKTRDKDLLEDCFRMNDVQTIKATIQRQQSYQIATLLELIAERIHKRPGRTGKLMTWVQWSLVSHGGYLANQPELMKKLKSLGQVVRERANGLQPLLHLKGKLDLLSAQLDYRRKLQADSRAVSNNEQDDEENVLYIEGQHNDWSDSDDDEAIGGAAVGSSKSGKARSSKILQIKDAGDDSSADEEDDDEDMPNKGLLADEESSGESEDDSPGEGMLDVEAEEVEDDDDDEEEDDESESSNDEAPSVVSSEEDDDSSDGEAVEVDAVRQPRPSTLNRKR